MQSGGTMFWSEKDDISCIGDLFKFFIVNIRLLVELRNFAYLFVLILFSIWIFDCLLNWLCPLAGKWLVQRIEIECFIDCFQLYLKPIVPITHLSIHNIKVKIIPQFSSHSHSQNCISQRGLKLFSLKLVENLLQSKRKNLQKTQYWHFRSALSPDKTFQEDWTSSWSWKYFRQLRLPLHSYRFEFCSSEWICYCPCGWNTRLWWRICRLVVVFTGPLCLKRCSGCSWKLISLNIFIDNSSVYAMLMLLIKQKIL